MIKGLTDCPGDDKRLELEAALAHVGAIVETPSLYNDCTGMENLRQRNRFSTISRITRKPIPPKNIKRHVTRFKNTSSL